MNTAKIRTLVPFVVGLPIMFGLVFAPMIFIPAPAQAGWLGRETVFGTEWSHNGRHVHTCRQTVFGTQCD